MLRPPSAIARGYALILVSALVLTAVIAGAFWYGRATAVASMSQTGRPSADATEAAADDAQSGPQILLGLAGDAMRDGRLVAPAGNNAYEFYLSVLQLEPGSLIAHDALRESFPRATVEIEQTINQKELEEARREIDLLREFDRTNYTLVLLASKLGAQRQLLAQQHEVQAAQLQHAAAAPGI